MGNIVPHSTAKHETSSTRLLKRKLDSREISDSSLFSLFKWEKFMMKKNRHVKKITTRKIMNQLPIDDCANACTELTTPLRVRNVPNIDNKNVMKMSHTFHIFIIPRFSCIITECKNAVTVSHGSREAFSTGSQPQYPPQPRTA